MVSSANGGNFFDQVDFNGGVGVVTFGGDNDVTLIQTHQMTQTQDLTLKILQQVMTNQ